MTEQNIRALACAVTLQAVKDFLDGTPKERNKILKDLRSDWMQWFTDGISIVVAEQLEKNPEEVAKNMRRGGELR